MKNSDQWCLGLGLLISVAGNSCSDRATQLQDSGADQRARDLRPGLQDGKGADHARLDGRLTDSAKDGRWFGDQAGAMFCDPATVTCMTLPPSPCNIGEIRTVVSFCWGDCVPIEQCTDVPAQPNCDLTGVLCDRMTPLCPLGYVPTNNGNSCYGPCVPITTCACTSNGPKTQCPADHICHNYIQRCGPLI